MEDTARSRGFSAKISEMGLYLAPEQSSDGFKITGRIFFFWFGENLAPLCVLNTGIVNTLIDGSICLRLQYIGERKNAEVKKNGKTKSKIETALFRALVM